MKNNYSFFTNLDCEYYPCHDLPSGEVLNCLFCYCPLYPYLDCGGDYILLTDGIKDCSECTLVHGPFGYEHATKFLIKKMNGE